jgi:hypothetical protein
VQKRQEKRGFLRGGVEIMAIYAAFCSPKRGKVMSRDILWSHKQKDISQKVFREITSYGNLERTGRRNRFGRRNEKTASGSGIFARDSGRHGKILWE